MKTTCSRFLHLRKHDNLIKIITFIFRNHPLKVTIQYILCIGMGETDSWSL